MAEAQALSERGAGPERSRLLRTLVFCALTGLALESGNYLAMTRHLEAESEQQIASSGKLMGLYIGAWLSGKARVLETFHPLPDDRDLRGKMAHPRDAGGFSNVFFAYPNGAQKNANGIALPSGNRDPRRWHWWGRAVTHPDETFIEMPSTAAATGSAVSSLAHAVVRGGVLLGAVGADLEISSIMGELAHARLPGNGLAFIVNRDGRVFAHPDPKCLNARVDRLIEGVTPEMLAELVRDGAFQRINTDGRELLAGAFPVQGTEFKLVTISERATILEPARWLFAESTAVLIALALLAALVTSRRS